jgi:hypothetical protein
MTKMKTYDSKSYDLAKQFLQDEPNLDTLDGCEDLAITIQQAVEDWFEDKKRNYEPPDPPGWEGGFAENH